MKLSLICSAIVLFVCGASWQLRSQTPVDVSATVQFSDGRTASVTDFSNPVSVQPNEVVNITIQFPSNAVGNNVVVDAVEGGRTSIGRNVVVIGKDGTITFAFHAPADLGQKSIDIRSGATSYNLQFVVVQG